MTAHPERARALAYLRRKGTEAPGEQILRKVEATYARLERILEGVSEDEAVRKPDPATWCVQEVADHLVRSVEPAVGQLRALIADEPPGAPIAAGLLSADALERRWPEVLARLRTAHRRHLEAIADAVEADPPLERRVPAVMVVKVDDGSGEATTLEWVEPLDWKMFALVAHVHTLEHVHQIERIRVRIRGSE